MLSSHHQSLRSRRSRAPRPGNGTHVYDHCGRPSATPFCLHKSAGRAGRTRAREGPHQAPRKAHARHPGDLRPRPTAARLRLAYRGPCTHPSRLRRHRGVPLHRPRARPRAPHRASHRCASARPASRARLGHLHARPQGRSPGPRDQAFHWVPRLHSLARPHHRLPVRARPLQARARPARGLAYAPRAQWQLRWPPPLPRCVLRRARF
mmetsp:Transcript_381/g.1491  ORF Transcript_381/g.1491 Transcript_381/m.1491 type:complete len:208 (+) Transcript_381:2574-3197(+)